MTIDTTSSNVTDIATVRPAAHPLPLTDTTKIAKLRALIKTAKDAQREAEQLRVQYELLRIAPVTADDPRMLQVWIDAARAADDANRCHEYDDLVERIGGPTRDTLREQGYLDRSYRVRTHVTFEFFLTVEAASDDAAVDYIDNLQGSDIRHLLHDQMGGIVETLDLETWDARDADLDD